jgi:hypothetical protein
VQYAIKSPITAGRKTSELGKHTAIAIIMRHPATSMIFKLRKVQSLLLAGAQEVTWYGFNLVFLAELIAKVN